MQLMKHLPSFYYNSEEVRNIQASIGIENDMLQAAIKDLLDQLFVETATWGLEYWERYVGLEVDKNEILVNRRSCIMTRLRGQGTTTVEMIKNVCMSFTGGEVDVIEHTERYAFTIKFISIKGIPGNIEYLRGAIEEIKPAHLGFSFEYTYNTWWMVECTGNCWEYYELQNKTWEEVSVI